MSLSFVSARANTSRRRSTNRRGYIGRADIAHVLDSALAPSRGGLLANDAHGVAVLGLFRQIGGRRNDG